MENKGRTATAIITEDTELLMIGEKDFREIFQDVKYQLDKHREEILLKVIPSLKELRREKLIPILYAAQYFSKKKGEILFKQNDFCDHIYILQSGSITLHRSLQLSSVSEEAEHLLKLCKFYNIANVQKRDLKNLVISGFKLDPVLKMSK